KEVFLDLSRGISGDMFIAAMAHAGVDFRELEQIFHAGGIPVCLEIEDTVCNGIAGKSARISWSREQPLRRMEQITALLDRIELSAHVRQRSLQALNRLAQVEALVHGIDPADVHFHEVGALDTVVDVVGAFWALEQIGAARVSASAMPWFQGEVNISHGAVPLPAPATASLMLGKQVRPSAYDWEVTTPTGALLVDQLVDSFQSGPEGVPEVCGTGFGQMKKGFNGLRVFIFRPGSVFSEDAQGNDQVYVLESNIDHLTGEEMGVFFQEIMAAGALDVIYLPGIMKKNRPGGLFQVICRVQDLEKIKNSFFKNTLTLGIRVFLVSRSILPRKPGWIKHDQSRIKAKETRFEGQDYIRPEMDDLKEKAADAMSSPIQLRFKKNQA
ncbi:MAG: LarC family nickel insertion protein, partial [Desulfonatronovibrionaceae bacterium]